MAVLDKTMSYISVGNPLLHHLEEQKDMKLKGGDYHRTQIDLTYNSNGIDR